MTLVTVQYALRQRFPVDAARAYAWCVDFDPGDPQRERIFSTRRVRWLAEDLVELTDIFPRPGGRRATKVKLVRLRPSERSWTSTHLAGPNRYSQFWYQIRPTGRASSELVYRGLHVERLKRGQRRPNPSVFARRLCREDAAGWKHLARAMAHELRH